MPTPGLNFGMGRETKTKPGDDTAIEYGLIAALIAVAAITAMQSLGGQLTTTFNKVSTSMKTTT